MDLKTVSRYLYIFGLCLFAAALPLSKAFMTISQMVLGLAWILHFDYKEKIALLIKNRILWWLSALLFLHLVFLYNTEDFNYASRDILIKLPLFIIPFIVGSLPPLTKKELLYLLSFFILATLCVALIGIGKFILQELDYIEGKGEFRDLSPFISHIRFSLMSCFSITLLCVAYKEKLLSFWLSFLAFIILFLHLVMMESITGIGILLIIGLPLFMKLMGWRYKKDGPKIIYISSILAAVVAIYLFVEARDIFVAKDESMASIQKTAKGNYYYNNEANTAKENGYYINRYICRQELKEAWNKRSALLFDGPDKKNQPLEQTLIRYITSLGMKKDAEALAKLSDEDIHNVENGDANALNLHMNPVRRRIRELMWETDAYIANPSPSGNSLTQRFVFWKTGLDIVEKDPMVGVGTGDVQKAFDHQYILNQSTLDKNHRLHTHNQYITFWVSFGIFGLLFFLTMMSHFYFFTQELEFKFISQVFWIIILLSMISEDTLETQAGVSFFAFFFSVFWTQREEEKI